MISVSEAQKKMLKLIPLGALQKVTLQEAVGRVVAETIFSPHPLPFFNNSAMDGYALRSKETSNATPNHPLRFTVSKTIQAGDLPQNLLGLGKVARIFTGAMMPPGADAVVKQEDVCIEGKQMRLTRSVGKNENVRLEGEEIRRGEALIHQGTHLSPAAIGLLASVGLREVPIYSPPRVGLLITGSEVVSHTHQFRPGKIFDSNSFALTAALAEINLTPSFMRRCVDRKGALQRAIAEGLFKSDFLVVTGGVSVGDFDFVKNAAREVGVKEVFWKVRQKPGKPLFFGTAQEGRKIFFGLPGNPASALVCFYEYIRPALLKAMGIQDLLLPCVKATLKDAFQKKPGLTHFLKGKLSEDPEGHHVEILENQGSHMMSSFVQANSLVVIPEESERINPGGEVDVHLMPL